MLVSIAWLRSLCPFDGSAREVAAALTARGLTVDAIREEGDDAVLDIDVPANRPDCLSHRGLAREISAAWGVRLAPQPGGPAGAGAGIAELARVEVLSADLCGRYAARLVRDVRVGPSPAWVARRLSSCGLHAINNVVDASNLVLLELGHPIHVFDFQRIADRTVLVRRAAAGERLTTLDGVERSLDPEMLVIADSRRPVALAGIMGGADTGITDATREVLIEAAWFLPGSVRQTSRRLGMATDASHRFERGADPDAVAAAQEMAVRLLADLAGGTPAPGMLDVHPTPVVRRNLRLRADRVGELLGFDPGEKEIEASLDALGLAPSRALPRTFEVTVPTWRIDLEREADLVEEVGRHLGYERIPARLPVPGGEPPPHDPDTDGEERCRDVLAHLGLHEVFCYSMLAVGEDDPFSRPGSGQALAVTNPIAEPLARLRRSLLPGLIRSLDLNVRRGSRHVRLFEVGRVFLPTKSGGFPDERLRVGIAWCGAARPAHWSGPSPEVGLHHVIGVVESLLEAVRPRALWRRTDGAVPGLHPGKTAIWQAIAPEPAPGAGHNPSEPFAWCGALHPAEKKRLDLADAAFLAEVDLERLRSLPARHGGFTPLPRVPSVSRDLSLVLNPGVSFDDLRRLLAIPRPPAPVEFEVVDRYEGPPLRSTEIALTVRVILQPQERTLSDEEAEEYRAALVKALGEKEIRLRT